MKDLARNPFFMLSLVLTALLAFQVYDIVSAQQQANYTAPQGAPTNMAGVYEPLNTGADLQTKQGDLEIKNSLTVGDIGKIVFTSFGQIFFEGAGDTQGIRYNQTLGKLQFSTKGVNNADNDNWKEFGVGTGDSGGPNGLVFGSVVDNSSDPVSVVKYGVLDIDGVSYFVPLYKRSTDQDFTVNYLGPNPTSNSHTAPQCIGLGGTPTVVDTGPQEVPNQPEDDIWICRLSVPVSSPQCPSSWIQYDNWSETYPTTCSLTQTGGSSAAACTTNAHTFQNIPTENCLYLGGTCYAEIEELGCY